MIIIAVAVAAVDAQLANVIWGRTVPVQAAFERACDSFGKNLAQLRHAFAGARADENTRYAH